MKLRRLRAALAATTALTSIALADVQPAVALSPTPPGGAVYVILPGATATAATVAMQMPSGTPIAVGVLNPTTGTFTPSGLTAEQARAVAAEAKALQTTNAFSEIASAGTQATARANLGLGTAATLNVGTTSGTVAAGNDSRFAAPIITGGTISGANASGAGAIPTGGTGSQDSFANYLAQLVYVDYYGVSPANSDTANLAAINALIAKGQTKFLFGGGNYKFSGSVLFDYNNVGIFGQGPGKTTLTLTASTGDLLQFGAGTTLRQNFILRDIGIASSAASPTSGSLLDMRMSYNSDVYNVTFTGGYDVITANASQLNNLEHITIGGFLGRGVHALGGGSNLVLHYFAVDGGTGTQPVAGCYLEDWDGVWFSETQFNRSGTGCIIAPPSGTYFSHLIADSVTFDTSAVDAFRFKASGGTIQRIFFGPAAWFGTSTNNGIVIEGGSNLVGLDIIGSKIVNNGQAGIVFQSGGATNDVRLENALISGNSRLNNNIYSGVYIIQTNINNFQMIGCRDGVAFNLSNTQRYGIDFGAPNAAQVLRNFQVISNDFNSNLNGAINASVFANVNVTSRNIQGNTGLVTDASGTASVASGATSVTVTHGMGLTPALTDIAVTPTSALSGSGSFWISGITSTSFVINVAAAPTAAVTFAWQGRYH